MLANIAIAAAAGALVGALAGWCVAVVQLRAKHWRNSLLVRRHRAPLRDCVPVAWHLPCAMFGAIGSATLAVWLPLRWAIAAGSLGLPALVLALALAAIARQLRSSSASVHDSD